MGARYVIAAAALALLSGGSTASAGRWRLERVDPPSPSLAAVLNDVSCPSSDSCMAVGWYRTSFTDTEREPLAEHWDGHRWSALTPPAPKVGRFSQDFLSAVSCLSSNSCVAVGYGASRSGDRGLLTESWDGSSWTVQQTPSGYVNFRALSCSSSTACTAVIAQLVERWDGSTWTEQTLPNLDNPYLTGVSCTGVSSCIAVGSQQLGANERRSTPLVVRWDGSRWSIVETPEPRRAWTSGLGPISCSSPTACTALGGYLTGARSAERAFMERWNGRRWLIQRLASPGRGRSASLLGVSCPSARTCTAVGQYTRGRRDYWTFAERWSHHRWSVQQTPNARGAFRSTLSAVSCPTPGLCFAVGYASHVHPRAATKSPLAERYS